MKRETLGDVLLKKAEVDNRIDLNAYANGLDDGAKWQQQRSYSEEEVINLISDILYEVRYDYSNIDIIENNIINIFEQFKK